MDGRGRISKLGGGDGKGFVCGLGEFHDGRGAGHEMTSKELGIMFEFFAWFGRKGV